MSVIYIFCRYITYIIISIYENIKHKLYFFIGSASELTESAEYIRYHGVQQEEEVTMSAAGVLPCKRLLHAISPKWQRGNFKENIKLYNIIIKCIQRVKFEGYESIAIPAIKLGFPLHVAVKVTVQAIKDCLQREPRFSLREVHLVDQEETALVFIHSLKSLYLLHNDPALHITGVSMNYYIYILLQVADASINYYLYLLNNGPLLQITIIYIYYKMIYFRM